METEKSQDTYKHEEPPVGAEHLLLASFECCCGQVQTLLSIYVSYLQQSYIWFTVIMHHQLLKARQNWPSQINSF